MNKNQFNQRIFLLVIKLTAINIFQTYSSSIKKAINNNLIEDVEYFINQNIDINQTDDENLQTPIMLGNLCFCLFEFI